MHVNSDWDDVRYQVPAARPSGVTYGCGVDVMIGVAGPLTLNDYSNIDESEQ